MFNTVFVFFIIQIVTNPRKWISCYSYIEFCWIFTTTDLNHGTLQVYALSRDKGIPFSSIWRQLHPKRKVPSNAVWLCAAICILLGLPILRVNVVFTAITSICTIGWVGGYAVPIFATMVMAQKNFKARPFLWAELEDQSAWLPFCGFVILVQSFFYQLTTQLLGTLSIMHL